MNRTDRLYAIVEELRAVSPRPRSARQLADRYEVSVRTIERDISALQQAGVPIYAEVGRRGGYALDRTMTLPPLNFTAAEAAAIAIALARATDVPYAREARTALRKVMAAMPGGASDGARALSTKVRLLFPVDSVARQPLPAVIEEAVQHSWVLALEYVDARDRLTSREVEPVLFVGGRDVWYLIGWCRLRADARAFRLDRIASARITGERAPSHDVDKFAGLVPKNLRVPGVD
ncbi:MAG: helix-turn-helix transcriptional regulator [Mycobacteriales bacterium]